MGGDAVTWAEWFLVAVLVTVGLGIPALAAVKRANRFIDGTGDESGRGGM